MKFFVSAPMMQYKISRMLKKDSVKHVVGKMPSLEEECVRYYDKEISDEEIYGKLIKTRTNVDIEINCFFAYIVKPLKFIFPQAEVNLVVEDGRCSIERWLKWRLYRTSEFLPFKKVKMNEFEKCCHLWAATNEFALASGVNIVKTESPKVLFGKTEEEVFWKICGRVMKEFNYV